MAITKTTENDKIEIVNRWNVQVTIPIWQYKRVVICVLL